MMFLYVAVNNSVLQCVAVCVAVCCSALHTCEELDCLVQDMMFLYIAVHSSVLQCVLQYVAVRCIPARNLIALSEICFCSGLLGLPVIYAHTHTHTHTAQTTRRRADPEAGAARSIRVACCARGRRP